MRLFVLTMVLPGDLVRYVTLMLSKQLDYAVGDLFHLGIRLLMLTPRSEDLKIQYFIRITWNLLLVHRESCRNPAVIEFQDVLRWIPA